MSETSSSDPAPGSRDHQEPVNHEQRIEEEPPPEDRTSFVQGAGTG